MDSAGRPIGLLPLEEAVAKLAVALVEGTDEIESLLSDPLRLFRSQHLVVPAPLIVRFPSYVCLSSAETEKVSRRVLFARDHWSCAYCDFVADSAGAAQRQLTVDHVKPACLFPSRAAATFWENVVTACFACNNAKGDQLPWQFGRLPSVDPRRPHAVQLRFAGRLNPSQRDYVRAYFQLEADVAL